MGRAPCCSKEGLERGSWSSKEDALLINYIQAHGEGNWRSLPAKAGLLRCGKSCRLRWMNYLRPDIKRGNITSDEDDIIIKLHSLLGNRWSLIAKRLPGRTDNEIKNYWNSHHRKKLLQNASLSSKDLAAKKKQIHLNEDAKKEDAKTIKTYTPKAIRVSPNSVITTSAITATTSSDHNVISESSTPSSLIISSSTRYNTVSCLDILMDTEEDDGHDHNSYMLDTIIKEYEQLLINSDSDGQQ